MILAIKHIAIEGAGTLETYFRGMGLEFGEINVAAGEALPATLEGIEALILLGGPMNVYEEKAYPFLKDENALIRKALEKQIPVLGICLGAQLLAKACGAPVTKAARPEIGWYETRLTASGKADALFAGVPPEFTVFQWHEDTFAVPAGGVLLAEARTCRNQAFRVGNNAYGLQFHVEVTPAMIAAWIHSYTQDAGSSIGAREILEKARLLQEGFQQQARLLYARFADIVFAAQR